MKRVILFAALLISMSCEQITGVKPKPIDCAGRDTVVADANGHYHYAPKLGCLK